MWCDVDTGSKEGLWRSVLPWGCVYIDGSVEKASANKMFLPQPIVRAKRFHWLTILFAHRTASIF